MGWSTQIWTKMCNEVIFPRTFETAYFLHLKSISGIFRVLTTLESTILENSLFFGNLILRLNFHCKNIKIKFSGIY